MSATAAEGSSYVQARQTLIPLLREYTESLNARIAEVREIADQLFALDSLEQCEFALARVKTARTRCSRMEGAIDNLSRRVSQLLEHGRFEHEDDRVELQLRLADLESTLRASLDTTYHALQFAQVARKKAAQQK